MTTGPVTSAGRAARPAGYLVGRGGGNTARRSAVVVGHKPPPALPAPIPPATLSWSSEVYYRRYVTDTAAHYGIPERELFSFIEWREAVRSFAAHDAA